MVWVKMRKEEQIELIRTKEDEEYLRRWWRWDEETPEHLHIYTRVCVCVLTTLFNQLLNRKEEGLGGLKKDTG